MLWSICVQHFVVLWGKQGDLTVNDATEMNMHPFQK